MKWNHEVEQVIAYAEMAHEQALAELAAFGCIEFECGIAAGEWAEDEFASEEAWLDIMAEDTFLVPMELL